MQPSFTGAKPALRAKALVLGPRCVAERIEAELQDLGYEPVLSNSVPALLPSPADEDALPKIRAFLEAFLKLAGPSSSPFAHCVHPGVHTWAERPELAPICQELGLSVICPPVRMISLLSSRLNLLLEADRLGIPHGVISFDPVSSIREIEALLSEPGAKFPVVLKSTHGSSAHGTLVLHSLQELEKKGPLWLEQLRRNTGEALVFLERYIEGARRITVPFARLKDGRTEVFSRVDASLQSRYRKIVELCPAAYLDHRSDQALVDWTLRLVESLGYVGVGAFDFLVDGERVYLLEGLARLNTGFELWEGVDGVQAVAWQLAAIDGSEPLPRRQAPEPLSGISFRIYAEDSILQLPQPGWIREVSSNREWKFPRAEARLRLGPTVDEDGLLATATVVAREPEQALLIARGILDELWIAGTLQTNERFVSELLAHPWIEGGMFHGGFIDEEFVPELRPSAEITRGFAAVCAEALLSGDSARWIVGDQVVKGPIPTVSWVRPPERWELDGRPGISGVIAILGRSLRVCAAPVTTDRWQVRIGSWTLVVRRSVAAATGASTHRLRAMVSGKVHALLHQEGTPLPPHEPLVVIESLRMLVPHALPVSARVLRWKVAAEEAVHPGQELGEFEILRG